MEDHVTAELINSVLLLLSRDFTHKQVGLTLGISKTTVGSIAKLQHNYPMRNKNGRNTGRKLGRTYRTNKTYAGVAIYKRCPDCGGALSGPRCYLCRPLGEMHAVSTRGLMLEHDAAKKIPPHIIRQRCAEVRATWTEEERERRLMSYDLAVEMGVINT